MSEIKTFFRHCPACGRRFEIRLVRKEPLETRRETYRRTLPLDSGALGEVETVVEEEVPNTISVTDFRYVYRCKHCGHQWAEVNDTEDEGEPPEEPR
ncbi:MAG TPA: hypothetical protein VMS77_00455 [Conexivisphaerales archaeon]|nr:hypothetical protein [Conexivisphaerales archaeon]